MIGGMLGKDGWLRYRKNGVYREKDLDTSAKIKRRNEKNIERNESE